MPTEFEKLLAKFPAAAEPPGAPSAADGDVLDVTPVKRRRGTRLDRVVALAVDLERQVTQLTARVLDVERRLERASCASSPPLAAPDPDDGELDNIDPATGLRRPSPEQTADDQNTGVNMSADVDL